MIIEGLDLTAKAPIYCAYIDPGTGSMLFAILASAVSVAVYGLRGLLVKLRFLGGKSNTPNIETKYAIFTDSKRYWNTFKPICDEFEKRETKISYLTQSEDDPCFKEKYKYVLCEFIGEGNKGFTRMNYLHADIVLSTTPSLDVFQWKRSKDVKYYIHVLHAANDSTGYRVFGLDYYDSVILSGNYQVDQIRKLEELRKINKKELLLLGLPYLDEMEKRVQNSRKYSNETKVVLLAPSWGKSSILVRFGSKIIDALLNTGYEIIVRPHPQSFTSDKEVIDRMMKKYPQIEWNSDNDNFDVLNKADIMISDFSGVVFDFALVFDKPVIYTNTSFDKAPYDAYWLDEEMWVFKALKQMGKELTEENFTNIKDIIDECLNDNKYANIRQQLRDEAWVNRGNSVNDIVDYMIKKEESLRENNNDNI